LNEERESIPLSTYHVATTMKLEGDGSRRWRIRVSKNFVKFVVLVLLRMERL